jgi:hypothetical protein
MLTPKDNIDKIKIILAEVSNAEIRKNKAKNK